MSTLVKICGLNSPESLEAALASGADMVGFVFFAKSPRNVDFSTARALSAQVRGGAERVALLVDAEDATIEGVIDALAPDWLQLHGNETPERVRTLRQKFGRPILKALGVAREEDLAAASTYLHVADRLLFDAKPGPSALLPGGNGLSFDWTLLQGYAGAHFNSPWLLSGGLDAGNVAEALRLTQAPGVDVSSGVEDRPGVKNPDKISAFIAAVRKAGA
jgi:phosphoribosylanthranilate isomerase